MGEEGDKLGDRPGVRDRGDEVPATQAEAELGEPGTVSEKMCSSLTSLEAEAAARGGVGFTEAEVVAEIIVTSQEGNTPAQGGAVQGQQGVNQVGARAGQEVLGHTAPGVFSPVVRPGLTDRMGD